jgi:hypothetical protein
VSADLRGRDVRKLFAPKVIEYKPPRGRPPKYRGYDFADDKEQAESDVQTSWDQIGNGTQQILASFHEDNPNGVLFGSEWATEAWLHGEGGAVRADSTEELVAEWLAVNRSTKCPRFKRTRPWRGTLPLPWFLKRRSTKQKG